MAFHAFFAIIPNAVYISEISDISESQYIYLDDRGSRVIVSELLSEIHTSLTDYQHPEKQILSFINRFEVKVGTEVVKMH